jgi:hypothetical protein
MSRLVDSEHSVFSRTEKCKVEVHLMFQGKRKSAKACGKGWLRVLGAVLTRQLEEDKLVLLAVPICVRGVDVTGPLEGGLAWRLGVAQRVVETFDHIMDSRRAPVEKVEK